MKTQSDRIKQARKDAGLSQSDLSTKVGVSRVAITQWENNPSIKIAGENLTRLCAALGVSAEWLLYGREKGVVPDARIIEADESESFVSLLAHRKAGPAKNKADYSIPILSVEASAGHGAVVASDDPVGFMEMPRRMLNDLGIEPTRSLRIVSVRGDSMNGTLDHGDFAIIDTAVERMEDDGVYVFTLDGQTMIKRLQRLPGNKIKVISDNPAYDSYTLDVSHNAVVQGRLRGKWSFNRM